MNIEMRAVSYMEKHFYCNITIFQLVSCFYTIRYFIKQEPTFYLKQGMKSVLYSIITQVRYSGTLFQMMHTLSMRSDSDCICIMCRSLGMQMMRK